MKRFIIAGTIALLAAITVGTTLWHDTLLQAFASSDLLLQGVRVALIGLLVGLLLTSPPRSIEFRIVLAAMSIVLGLGALSTLLQYSLPLLDSLVFIEIAIIFAIEAIEAPEAVRTAVKKAVPAKTPKTAKS